MKSWIFAITSFLTLLPVALFAWGGAGCPYGGYGPGMMGRWYGGFFGGGFIMMILNLLLLALLVFFAIKYFRGTNTTPGKEGALEILKNRYAKGEITKEVFESMKRDIKES